MSSSTQSDGLAIPWPIEELQKKYELEIIIFYSGVTSSFNINYKELPKDFSYTWLDDHDYIVHDNNLTKEFRAYVNNAKPKKHNQLILLEEINRLQNLRNNESDSESDEFKQADAEYNKKLSEYNDKYPLTSCSCHSNETKETLTGTYMYESDKYSNEVFREQFGISLDKLNYHYDKKVYIRVIEKKSIKSMFLQYQTLCDASKNW